MTQVECGIPEHPGITRMPSHAPRVSPTGAVSCGGIDHGPHMQIWDSGESSVGPMVCLHVLTGDVGNLD